MARSGATKRQSRGRLKKLYTNGSPRTDKPGMWNSIVSRVRSAKAAIENRLVNNNDADYIKPAPEWYTGLAVSPVAFSEQLGNLQLSLQRANAGHPAPAAAQTIR